MLALPNSVASAQPQAKAESSPARTADGRPEGLVALGVSIGALTYTSTFMQPILSGGGPRPPNPYVNRGGFLGAEARYAVTRSVELATRARIGWLQRGPPTVLDEHEVLAREGQDLASLDPRLGDSHWGGAVAILARYMPPLPFALDVGVTVAVSSLRMRLAGAGVMYQYHCGDCDTGQEGLRAYTLWPTVRFSRAGYGFFYSLAIGEPFVRTHEPGLFETLLGYRSECFSAMAGIGSGIALRLEAALPSDYVLSADVSYKPWGTIAIDHVSIIGVLTLSRRLSGYAAF